MDSASLLNSSSSSLLLLLLLSFLFLFSFLSVFHLIIIKKPNSSSTKRPKLPPGSLGWPYIGETLHLYSKDPNFFFLAKQKRYGEIFKTHILGCPCIMLPSPEAARFVLVTHAHLFRPTYPRSKEELIGPSALFFHQGYYHTRLRRIVQSSLYPKTIRRFIPDIEALAVSALDSWTTQDVINTFHHMKKFAFDLGILAIFGHLDNSLKEELWKNYQIVNKGYNCFPTKFPGTAYHQALMARKSLGEILSEIIHMRKKEGMIGKDLLGNLLNSKDEKEQTLSEEQVSDNIIGVLFAAQDTTASALTWVLKYLHNNHKLLEAVKVEQMGIYQLNDGGKRALTWGQIKEMGLTYKVVLESLRMASIISFVFREAAVDVEYKGYLIPKGWKVMPLFRNIHHSQEFFPNPEKFDPSRFEANPRPNTFMPFGSGVHSCPGNELAKLQILIFIHHLVTKFRWEVMANESEIHYGPFPVPNQGLPARFMKEPIRPKQKLYF